MKLLAVISVILAAMLLLHDVAAEEFEEKPMKKKHHKKHHRKHKTTTTVMPSSEGFIEVKEESYFDTNKQNEDILSRKTLMERINNNVADKDVEDRMVEEKVREAPQAQTIIEETVLLPKVEERSVDPCSVKHCGAGRECQVSEDGEAICLCIRSCPQEAEARRKVCTNFNETWSSDCEVYQKRCQCEENSVACSSRPEYAHVHIEYYGECRDMPECLPGDMADFPRRMRDWLFQIMRDMADRDLLSPHYQQLHKEAETNLTRRWTNAAVWKFCDLDGHPPDRSVSRHELFPIRAPLMALEHCIAPFLNGCDADNDHLITLKEWAKCLELNENEIEDQCEDVRDGEE